MQIENRRHYRVMYPSAMRPQLRVGAARLTVIDLCEQGLRFAHGLVFANRVVGSPVVATLRFRDGETETIRGSVVRVTDRDVALSLERGLSFQTIVREQRRLLEAAPFAVR